MILFRNEQKIACANSAAAVRKNYQQLQRIFYARTATGARLWLKKTGSFTKIHEYTTRPIQPCFF